MMECSFMKLLVMKGQGIFVHEVFDYEMLFTK